MISSDIDQAIRNADILIVDDNAANVDLLREILRHQGYSRVVGETDSRNVPDLCRKQVFDIILLDIRMPHLSGFQLLEIVRPIFGDELVPILVLTAQTDQETRRKALEMGANDFLTKPFITWELMHRVRNMLHIRMLYRSLRDSNRALENRVAERTRELEEALDATRQADRAKLDFLSVMSHELRTPLNAIIGFSEVLGAQDNGEAGKAGALDDDAREYVKLIEESGKHLLVMVNRILEYTRGTSSAVPLEEQPFDLALMMRRCVATLQATAEEHGVQMVLLPPEESWFTGDERRIRDITLALLDNAVKFSNPGGTVTLELQPDTGDDAGGLMLVVSDTGLGMPPELQARAFHPFTQGETALDRQHGGIGLGLPIVQRFAKLHGGRVHLESTPGQGTTVRVHLPASRRIPRPI